MSRTLQELESELLGLDAPVRAALVKRLLQSLDSLSEQEYDDLWVAEADDRYAAFLRGEMDAEDGDGVLARARNRTL